MNTLVAVDFAIAGLSALLNDVRGGVSSDTLESRIATDGVDEDAAAVQIVEDKWAALYSRMFGREVWNDLMMHREE